MFITANIEVQRRQLALLAGAFFGVGWLVFIDSLLQFNRCWDQLDYGDPCSWGPAPLNATSKYVHTPDSPPPSFNPFPPWPGGGGQPTTTPEPVTHKGWSGLDGKYKLVYIPGIIALVSLFFVNTVNVRDLSEDTTEVAEGASPVALKVWLFTGMIIGFTSIALSIWVYADLFSRSPNIQDDPALAAMIQTIFIAIASYVFFIARSIGGHELWGTDPLL
ncbi:hypothetical protein GUITHDRAFT_162568 [Guillardia theta CCMP2712]|uniref:Uncharacterized protein n=2 Tax=Guillardia theta TaxID=55529 RepID=L1JGY1_GUITC|nr:hypothetical protein GUITHDRAFT_162568 [Guillardia theta CCMP2712]EKX47761.1 hypothetical protein GUITHDRAFT_162568 [Guillardia theta CCMP2712]|eukprot:XP_005834741.1 hypothetical protein GUITHDRAFT_162568 [Guillardia theta CCMP2712]